MDLQKFHNILFSWWERNKRQFPWRNTSNPYYITVSEFMLQQTQATRVIPKYNQFLKKFPTMKDLTGANVGDVIRIWQGLGYNRRAIWLKESIKKISELPSFPKVPSQLMQLKGIGPYTSRAILIFSFNLDIATVDTNIRRILVHFKFATEETSSKNLFKIASRLVPLGRSRDYHNALMDYGAIAITPAKTGIKSNTTQSKYEGSRRETRGKIIQMLTDSKFERGVRMEQLSKTFTKQDILTIVSDLETEGLIVIEDKRVKLPS